MVRSRRSTSASVSALVGSSITIMEALSESAFAISTSCWSPTRKEPVFPSGEIDASSKVSSDWDFFFEYALEANAYNKVFEAGHKLFFGK